MYRNDPVEVLSQCPGVRLCLRIFCFHPVEKCHSYAAWVFHF